MSLPTPSAAETTILAALTRLPTEDCPLAHAHGRVLRRALVADRPFPPFDRVTMDGYAINTSDLTAPPPESTPDGVRTLQVVAIQAAGMLAKRISTPGTCIEIATGATLPHGTDAIIPYELVTRADDVISFPADLACAPGQNIHRAGSDFAQGAEIVPAGTRFDGPAIGAAASVGAAHVSVSLRPSVAIIATGDELVEVDSPTVAAHQIRKSNDYALRAALLRHGLAGKIERFHFRDHRPDIETGLRRILAEFDLVLLTGGVSKGKYDYVPAVLAQLHVSELLRGVAQRPGKPLWFGLTPRRSPVFALPGNPVSALTCLHRYVLPALDLLTGATPAPAITVALDRDVDFPAPLAYFLPVTVHTADDARLCATPHPFNTSGDLGGLVGTTGFIELPADQTHFPAGTPARYRPWF